MKRDGANTSLWQLNPDFIPKNAFSSDERYDVAIIGGGITGLTTALLLQQAGKKCIVVEAQTLGFGTTGGTTAHLNTFFDTTFGQVKSDFGEENAQLLARGAKEAMVLISTNIRDYNIDCDYDKLDGFIFAVEESQNSELQEIVEAAQSVGVEVDYAAASPFPIPWLRLAVFKGQVQFNPGKYILSLATAFESQGGVIVQNSRVTSIETDRDLLQVVTGTAMIQAAKAIYATHIPPGVNLLHFRCAPYRSYALAVKLNGNYPDATGYDLNDPYHYYRSQRVGDELFLIAGGEDHKTGHNEDAESCFNNLELHLRQHFDVQEVAYKWSSQYFEPADGLPYIGNLPGGGDNIYVATGFGGNGMIYGTLSAIIFSELFTTGASVYQHLFTARVKPVAGFTNFIKEGADAVASFIKGKFSGEKIAALDEISAGEAQLVKHEGHQLAIYKDDAMQVHIVNPTCTHTGCTVAWNNSEKTWDCPCHGARYSPDGQVLTGPAQKDLEQVDWENK